MLIVAISVLAVGAHQAIPEECDQELCSGTADNSFRRKSRTNFLEEIRLAKTADFKDPTKQTKNSRQTPNRCHFHELEIKMAPKAEIRDHLDVTSGRLK